MALKINQIDEQSVTGILDGVASFQVNASEDGVTARISKWTCTLAGRAMYSVSGMRSSAYEALARYREEQKQSLNSQVQSVF
ncbi:hypothetical protein [Leisingera methylohalidivorans]|uniref:Uncharacterized protein n=1 Tax=Leisingera methylohalidivorans DSM 14336 TaxID=999552 RepID=V9W135_9RHOB|nr:hypothetical protein [Leisingera methylohalidivorans]AHD02877.1 hypothetical protein METH_04110 [Leisingera methylohalidivorans DSM 14336]